jgi:hypothetical protein
VGSSCFQRITEDMTMTERIRAPRPVRRLGTEVHADTRTAREREGGQAERAEIERELEALRSLKAETR